MQNVAAAPLRDEKRRGRTYSETAMMGANHAPTIPCDNAGAERLCRGKRRGLRSALENVVLNGTVHGEPDGRVGRLPHERGSQALVDRTQPFLLDHGRHCVCTCVGRDELVSQRLLQIQEPKTECVNLGISH